MSKREFKKLLDVAYVIRGVTFDKGDVSDSPSEGLLPILRAGNIGNKLDTKNGLIYVPAYKVRKDQLLQVGDVTICMSSGSPDIVGKTSKLEEKWKGSVGAFCAIIRFYQNVIPKFGALFFQSRAFVSWRKHQAEGANIKNIRKSDLESLMLPVPPLDEQKRIVLILDEAEEMKRLRAKANTRTADLMPALFDDMFGDLVRNEKGWEIGTLSNFCEMDRSIASEKDSNLLYLGLEDIESDTGRILQPKKESEIIGTCFKFTNDHILYGKLRPYLNKVALPNFTGRCSTELIPLNPKVRESKIFVANLLRSKHIVNTVMSRNTGTRMPRADMDYLLYGIKVYLPPIALQNEFAARVEEIRAFELDQSIGEQKVGSLFQSLLHRAFEGEL